jgi:hypothetical protein
VASALGRFGRQSEQVTVVEQQVEQGLAEKPFADVVLGVRRDTFVRARAPLSPLHTALHGPLRFKTEDSITAEWCFDQDARPIDRVHIMPLQSQPVRGTFDRFRVVGLRLDLAEAIVNLIADPTPATPPAICDAPVDFMADMLQDHRRKRSRQQPQAEAPPVDDGVDPLAAMLAELCDEEELGDELRAILKEPGLTS